MSQGERGTPLWQQYLNGVDRILAPRLEELFRHEAFGLAAALTKRAGSDFKARAERLSRHGLHALNIPAASDVNRLLKEIAFVERQLRILTETVDAAGRPARQRGAETSARDRSLTAARPAARPLVGAAAPAGTAHEKD